MNILKFKDLSIRNKVRTISVLLVLFVLLNTLAVFFMIEQNEEKINHSFHVITPSLEAINDFRNLVTKSRMYIMNWVNTADNEEDKEFLRELHNFEFPKIVEELSRVKKEWTSSKDIAEIDSAIMGFDAVVQQEQIIMEQYLADEKDYENIQNINNAKRIIQQQIIPKSKEIVDKLKILADKKVKEKQVAGVEVTYQMNLLRYILMLVAFLFFLGAFVASFFANQDVSKPIHGISDAMMKLSKGIIPDDMNFNAFNKDEIGLMAQAMKKMIEGFTATSEFAENIGKGNYKWNFVPLSEHDVLGNSLIEMRNNLAKVAEEERKRNWITEGVAIFGEILRSNYVEITTFSYEVIHKLVLYTEANQGGLFLINEEKDVFDQEYMSLMAMYAWEKRRYLEKKIYRGDGLAGQAWQEGITIYATEIPAHYIMITSGLGEANPTSILIVPIKSNNTVYGVIELAFFQTLEKHEIDFVERIAESFASTLSNVRTNERTQHLLKESQELTEQMRAQEEEMRQNMEEIQATQEMAERKSREAEAQLSAINQSVAMLELDAKGAIISINDKYLQITGYEYNEIISQPHTFLIKRGFETSKTYMQMWEDLHAGRPVEGEFERVTKDESIFWMRGTYYPVLNRFKKLEKIIHIAADITEQKEQATKMQKTLDEQQELFMQMQEQEKIMVETLKELEVARQKAEQQSSQLQKTTVNQQGLVAEMRAQEAILQNILEEMNQNNTQHQEKVKRLEEKIKMQEQLIIQYEQEIVKLKTNK